MMVVRLSQNDLHKIIKNVIKETLNYSYKSTLKNAIRNRIPDFNFNAWSDKEDNENIERGKSAGFDLNAIKEKNHGQTKSIWDEMEKLGFKRRTTKGMYDGYWENYMLFKIPVEKFDSIKDQYQHLLNFFGYIQYNFSRGKYEDDNGNIQDVYYVTIEPKYGIKEINAGIYYHATPANHVKKIQKIGLVPRDEGKRGDFRGPRIYLTKYYDCLLFQSLFPDDYDYTWEVFKVDLTGMEDKIKVYTDEMAKNGVYTYDNIPPQCLTLMPNEYREEKKIMQNILSIATKHNGVNLDGQSIEGICDNGTTQIHLKVYPKPYVAYNWQRNYNVEGKRMRISSNTGRRITTTIKKGFNSPEEIIKFLDGILTNG